MLRFAAGSGGPSRRESTSMSRFTVALIVLLVSFTAWGCASWPPKSYTFVSKHSGMALGLPVPGGYLEGDGIQQIGLNNYHLGLQTSWQLRPEVPSTAVNFSMISLHSGKCVDLGLANGGNNDGDSVRQMRCNGGQNQKFRIVPTAPDEFQIVSVYSNKCLQVSVAQGGANPGMNEEDPIEQWTCSMDDRQIWKRTELTNAPNPPYDSGKGQLCDACVPGSPTLQCKSPGAKCVVWSGAPSFCADACSASKPCPPGFHCTRLKSGITTVDLCLPEPDPRSCPLK